MCYSLSQGGKGWSDPGRWEESALLEDDRGGGGMLAPGRCETSILTSALCGSGDEGGAGAGGAEAGVLPISSNFSPIRLSSATTSELLPADVDDLGAGATTIGDVGLPGAGIVLPGAEVEALAVVP